MRFSRFASIALLVVLAAVPRTYAGMELEIEGNTVLSPGTIRSLLERPSGLPLEARIARVQGEYYKRGYLFASIEATVSPDSSLVRLSIDEGNKARYRRVRVSGVSAAEAGRIGGRLGARRDAPFEPVLLERGIGDLLREYDASGYPFVQIWLDSVAVDREHGVVDVTFFVSDNGQKRIGAVVFEGLQKTRPEVALALSGLRTGQVYDGRRLAGAVRRLRSLGVFTSVGEPAVTLAPDGSGVEARIIVREPSRTNTFQAALGYAKEETDRPRVFSGLASLEFNNLGGRLMDLDIYWRNDGAERSETRIAFTDRLFMGRALGVGVSLEQIGLDTLYTWQSAGVEVTLPLGSAGRQEWAVSASVHGDRNIFSEGTLKRSWRVRMTGGLAWRWGSEEERLALHFDGRMTYAGKRQYRRTDGGDENVSQYITGVIMRTSLGFGFARLFNESSYHGIESNEEAVPLSEQFYLGGAGSLRGYRENQFHGTRVALSRTEMRFGPSAFENAYLFVDGGYVRSGADGGGAGARDLFRAGYGFGLRTVSRVGEVDLSFGVGEKLSLQQTKVHVILGQRF